MIELSYTADDLVKDARRVMDEHVPAGTFDDLACELTPYLMASFACSKMLELLGAHLMEETDDRAH